MMLEILSAAFVGMILLDYRGLGEVLKPPDGAFLFLVEFKSPVLAGTGGDELVFELEIMFKGPIWASISFSVVTMS